MFAERGFSSATRPSGCNSEIDGAGHASSRPVHGEVRLLDESDRFPFLARRHADRSLRKSVAGLTKVLGQVEQARPTANTLPPIEAHALLDRTPAVLPSTGDSNGRENVSCSSSHRSVLFFCVAMAGAVIGAMQSVSAAPPSFEIAGVVTPADLAAGTTVTLSGSGTATTTVDGTGHYSFAGLHKGSYVVTPTQSGEHFTPLSSPVAIRNHSVGGVNFTISAGSQIFFDDFTGGTLDPAIWTVMDRPGDASNSEAECYTPANVSVSNGVLAITSKVQSINCGGNKYNYTSGMVQWTNFSFLYGTVEIRAKMAGGQGTWPALWLLGANCQQSNVQSADNVPPCSWPNTGSDEIDISEIKGGTLTTVWQNVIANGGGFQSCSPTTTDVSQNWHTYGLVWTPGSLSWTIDGVTTCSFSTDLPYMPMFLMINTAMGGSGGPIYDATLPQTLLVDYVRITQP